MSYKSTDGLMRHLRENGIRISGSPQKRQLINTGYFHGYKGYRFYKNSGTRLPYSSYDEVYATIQYDSELKSIFYGKIMFIETAVKNIALEGILANAKSESIQAMFDNVVSSYNKSPAYFNTEQKKKAQQDKLNLQKMIHDNLAREYRKKNPQITHFYDDKGSGVPIWALFETMTMGDLGHLLSCLTYDVREDISRRVGLNLSSDTDRQLVYRYIYTLKDLRNAVAHNMVVFDTRFSNTAPSKAMKECLKQEIGLPYINFKTIGDYVILITYFLKMLQVSKTEIKAFIRAFEQATESYKSKVNPAVANIVIHPDLDARMTQLKKYV